MAQIDSKTEEKKQEKPSLKGLIIDFVEVIVTASVLTFILLIFIQPSIVEGRSMYPTLHNNDKLLLWKIGDIKRNDIVVFDSHDENNDKYVKRVIAVAGDHVVVTNSTVTVNGEVLYEPYIYESNFWGDVDLVIPEGEIFVMGDNRNNSNDSRGFGPVSLNDVDGKMIFNFSGTIRKLFSNNKVEPNINANTIWGIPVFAH